MAELNAITAEQFSDKHWKNPGHYRFAANLHVVPVAAAELAQAVPVYPLAFVQGEAGWQLVAVLSLIPGNNLFLAPDGKWLGSYVPAVLRSYPFRLARPQGGGDAVLTILDDAEWIVPVGQGQAFFAEDRQPSEAIKGVLNFLAQLEGSRVATQKAVDALVQADLLAPWTLQANIDGEVKTVQGLSRIDEQKLNAVDPETLAGLRASGALALAYAQLFSATQLANLQRAAQVQAQLIAAQKAPNPFEGLGLNGDTLKFN